MTHLVRPNLCNTSGGPAVVTSTGTVSMPLSFCVRRVTPKQTLEAAHQRGVEDPPEILQPVRMQGAALRLAYVGSAQTI